MIGSIFGILAAPRERAMILWTTAAASLLVCMTVHGAAGQDGDLEWPQTSSETRPWTRWWWLGAAVDKPNLKRELSLLAEAGFGGVEVTSIYGVKGEEERSIEYLSPRWMEMLSYTAEEATRLGLGVDIPPGSGWRMGGPSTDESDAGISFRFKVDTVRGGDMWKPEPGGNSILGAAAYGPGRVIKLTDEQTVSHEVEWQVPEGEWQIHTVESEWSGDPVKRPGPGGAGYSIDPFSRRAVDNFLSDFSAGINGPADGTIRSFFHDSYEYEGDASAELFKTFRDRRGYDLLDYLPELQGAGDPDSVARVKSDYRETLSDMLLYNLVLPFTDWSHEHGGLSRNQAHGSPGHLLDLYAAADIPETEIFGPLDTSDNDLLISKFASSAANVTGRPLISSESFTWLEEHFTVPLDLLKNAADQLLVSGINHIFYHGTAYSPDDVEWPGWLFYASVQANPRNTIWRDIPTLNSYISRAQSVLQSGQPDNDVLLYWPIYDNWHDSTGLRRDFRVHNSHEWFYSQPFSKAATFMWENGYGFDYVSDRQLREISTDGDAALKSTGGYRTIVLPEVDKMPLETLEALVKLSEGGAVILVQGSLPADVPGLGRLDERRQQIGDLKGHLDFEPVGITGVQMAESGDGRWLMGNTLGGLLEMTEVRRESMVDNPGIQFVRRTHGSGYHYFIRHAGRVPHDGWITLGTPAQSVLIMDPMTGSTGLARLRTNIDGGQSVYLQLDPGSSIILRTFDRQVDAPDWTYRRVAGEPVKLEGTWHVEFIEGGPALPQDYETDELVSWTEQGSVAERFAGTARYTIVFEAPDNSSGTSRYLLDLGEVAYSARVRIDGMAVGTVINSPYRVEIDLENEARHILEIEVTNLSMNRIRDLDRREIEWQIFDDINFVNLDYGRFDASDWPLSLSGLLGPVSLQPLHPD